LKKSFLGDEQNFSAPLARPARGNVRDHIDSHKSDRRPSYLSYRALQRRRQPKTDFREIFGAARFSTFSTVSVKLGPRTASELGPFIPPDSGHAGTAAAGPFGADSVSRLVDPKRTLARLSPISTLSGPLDCRIGLVSKMELCKPSELSSSSR
jgi:hypothetical protein